MGGAAEHKTKYEVMEELAEGVLGLMEDIFQSGFGTVHDATLKEMGKAAEVTGQFGMTYLSELLAGLAEEAAAGRHRMEKKTARMAELYTDIIEYLSVCRQKTAYDRGFDYYTKEPKTEERREEEGDLAICSRGTMT